MLSGKRGGRSVDLAKVPAEAGADANAKTKKEQIPLFQACSSGSIKIVKILIGKGADIRDRDNRTEDLS